MELYFVLEALLSMLCGKLCITLLWSIDTKNNTGHKGQVKTNVTCSTCSHEFVKALTVFCQMASCGNIPPDFIPYFCGATLIASLKKNGGVRPIAIGEVLCRLVSKCLNAATLPQAIECLSPFQLGVGIPRGSQAIIHAVNIHLSSPSSDSVKPTLLVDFSNAFNSIDRSAMFSEIRQRLPSLSAWFESCCGSAPVLQYKVQLHGGTAW